MGVFASKEEKGASIPTAIIVKRLSECLVPDEKETILDYFEMLEIKITKKDHEIKNKTEFRENGLVKLVTAYLICYTNANVESMCHG